MFVLLILSASVRRRLRIWCSKDVRSELVFKADLTEQISQKRISASEKLKWGLDEHVFNAFGVLNAGGDLSHQRGVFGPTVPTVTSRRPIRRSCSWKGMTGASSIIDGGWSMVQPKFWWRKSYDSHGELPLKQHREMKGTRFLKKKLSGKCFSCLASGHYAFLCSAPVRCWQCLQAGHRARSCPRDISQGRSHSFRDLPVSLKHSTQRGSSFSSSHQQLKPFSGPLQKGLELHPVQAPPTSSLLQRKSYLQAVQGGQTMDARYPGDPRARPARAVCAIIATGLIHRRRDELISKAVVCSFDGNSHEVDVLAAGDMLRDSFLHHSQYQLVKHFPEQFFIIFADSRTKQWALDRRSVSYRGRVFHFGDWSEECYARKTCFEFRVKVRVEGIPVHYWGEVVAARALGRSCAIHYVQERSRRRDRTRSFDLWAWCSDLCDILKEVCLTVTVPDRELPPSSAPLPLVGALHDSPTD
jgi:hypothetical protein